MAQRVRARLTAAEGRRFGLTLGTAFGVLGGLLAWRGRLEIAAGAWVLAGALFGMALLAPRALDRVERWWMAFAHAISRVTTPLLMGIIYFLVLAPIAVLRRTFGSNPMVHRGLDSYWAARNADGERRGGMERQF